MAPRGFWGRVFGWLMQLLNASAYRWALMRLLEGTPERVLELGFGTGALAERCLGAGKTHFYAGVDPSPLMLQVARERLGKQTAEIDLRESTDADLPWESGSFDAVLAVHSFQFWQDPDATLRRIHALLKPGGTFVLVLRMHGRKPPAWLPNPYSHMGDERAGGRRALARAGFIITHDKRISTASYGLSARKA
ncbi:class I SAM-dependent methyltransferase [Kordiimonas marina]|uniref:class I SAM-dependent methyltransferase n=1 Tax=Kordiimonas marina TaxID=2872312 RepID=UPI001FF25ACF|nr:class I SAM-dependent methyltransferase [Kordiimonas marina]MCJ9428480.1 class I SAM-dependent methyltransferase [Kordiimonas marina]